MPDLTFDIHPKKEKEKKYYCICCGNIIKRQDNEFCKWCEDNLSGITREKNMTTKQKKDRAIKNSKKLDLYSLHSNSCEENTSNSEKKQSKKNPPNLQLRRKKKQKKKGIDSFFQS